MSPIGLLPAQQKKKTSIEAGPRRQRCILTPGGILRYTSINYLPNEINAKKFTQPIHQAVNLEYIHRLLSRLQRKTSKNKRARLLTVHAERHQASVRQAWMCEAVGSTPDVITQARRPAPFMCLLRTQNVGLANFTTRQIK